MGILLARRTSDEINYIFFIRCRPVGVGALSPYAFYEIARLIGLGRFQLAAPGFVAETFSVKI